ncbi:CAP domain-containing protein [Streptomyces sp. NPDC005708]|uniref:CAP domain-containing protein n=1 Tax=unclassified Streptomyces TaxID=2593676 RepID=UPI0033E4D3A8
MSKHRKEKRLRRIAIAAAAIAAVGVPSVAVACADWGNGGGHQVSSAPKQRAEVKGWWNDSDWYHDWTADGHSQPTAAASNTPTATAPAPRTTAPQRKATAPTHPRKTVAPAPRTTAPSAPKTTAAPAATPTPSSPAAATATAPATVARILALVNAERSKVGCSALTLNATLTKVAQAHSEDMAAHRNMSHTGSDGSSPGDRITRAGYNWSTYGENVAYGYATPEEVMAGWMSSPGHKANILNCSFKEIGVGLAQPDSYWTQDFGAAR